MGATTSQQTAKKTTWSINVKIGESILYTIEDGKKHILKTTGTGTKLVYHVDPSTGEMKVVHEGEESECGKDGNLPELKATLIKMSESIKPHLHQEEKQ